MEVLMAASPANLRPRDENIDAQSSFAGRKPLSRIIARILDTSLSARANHFRDPRATRWQRDRAFRRSLP
jgi:hypothetical protein